MDLPQLSSDSQSDLSWTGEKIKDLRHRLGWNQAELARRLRCRQQTVSEWETNIYQPQNAYSQLLDRIFENAQNFNIQVSKAPRAEAIMKDLKVSQVTSEIIEEKNDSIFDSFID